MSTSAYADGDQSRPSGPPSVDLAQLRSQGAEFMREWRNAHRASSCTSVYIPLDRIDFDEAVRVASMYAGFFGNVSKLTVKNENTMELDKQKDLYTRFEQLVRVFPRVSDLQLKVAAPDVDIGAFLAEVDKLVQLRHLEFRAWSGALRELRAKNLELLAAFVKKRHDDPAKSSVSSLVVVSEFVPLDDPKNMSVMDAFCATLRGARCACSKVYMGRTIKICAP